MKQHWLCIVFICRCLSGMRKVLVWKELTGWSEGSYTWLTSYCLKMVLPLWLIMVKRFSVPFQINLYLSEKHLTLLKVLLLAFIFRIIYVVVVVFVVVAINQMTVANFSCSNIYISWFSNKLALSSWYKILSTSRYLWFKISCKGLYIYQNSTVIFNHVFCIL